MATPSVVRVPRSDEKGSFILVQVSPTGSGSRPLNARLVATDGTAPYVVPLRQNQTEKWKAKSSPCSQEEWDHILTSVLLDREAVPDVDATATVEDGQSLTLNLHKSVQGIKQRLGSISFSHKADEIIELFDWCNAAIEKRSKIKEDLASAARKAEELEGLADELRSQLEELIKAKDDDESALLEKFRQLLNEKKVKIREQQRVLASAKADANGASPAAEAKRDKSPPGAARASRQSKRKVAEAVLEEEDSDNGFEKMDVDRKEEDNQVSEDQQTTDGEATESEPDEDEPVAPVNTSSRVAKSGSTTTRPSQAQKHNSPAPEAPPPKRIPPLGEGTSTAKPSTTAPSAAQDGSETESDDEL